MSKTLHLITNLCVKPLKPLPPSVEHNNLQQKITPADNEHLKIKKKKQ